MLARPQILSCALGLLSLAAPGARAADCGNGNPDQPRCPLPPLSSERLAIETCHTLPVDAAGQMLRLSRGTSLLDIKAELFQVNADASSAQLLNEWAVSEVSHSSSIVLDNEYFGSGFYFHSLVRLDDIDSPNHLEVHHLSAAGLDADLSCTAL